MRPHDGLARLTLRAQVRARRFKVLGTRGSSSLAQQEASNEFLCIFVKGTGSQRMAQASQLILCKQRKGTSKSQLAEPLGSRIQFRIRLGEAEAEQIFTAAGSEER